MSKGYNVSADHIGYPNGKPDEWKGQRADIYAEKGEKKIFIEAETCGTIESKETKVQWVTLSSKEGVDFGIIIPQRCEKKAKEKAEQWGVELDAIWTMDT